MAEPDLVLAAVRAADRDRYLSLLYAPAPKRPALAALYAFNADVASIRDRTREPTMGEIRLQWWRDVLQGVAAAGGHPIAEALLAATRAERLPIEPLLAMLDARTFDLYDDPMPSRNDLEGYCGETAGALIQLASLVLDAGASSATAELAGHAGCAQAIAGLLLLLPTHRTRGHCTIPRDILSAAGTSPEEFLAGADEGAACRAVLAMAALGGQHFAAFSSRASRLEPTLRPAYLPLSPVSATLRRITAHPLDALKKSAPPGEWRRQWLMLRRAMGGW